MKQLFFLFLAGMLLLSCEPAAEPPPTEEPAPVDKEAIEAELGNLMDRYYEAARSGNAEDLGSILSDGGLFLGTDPSEVFSKSEVLEAMTGYTTDPEYADLMTFEVTRRIFRIADDGASALVTDHTNVGFSKMPVRTVSHFVKEGDQWLVDYFNSAFMLKNEDLPTVDAALGEDYQ